MNINLFFTSIFIGLFMIYFLFEPLNQKNSKHGEIPLLELKNFKLTELNKEGLSSALNASVGFRYKNRYILEKLNFTDSNEKYITNIHANKGIYRGNSLKLNGNVKYFREDGIIFDTQNAKYNKKTKIITSSEKYIAYIGDNKVTGSSFMYNNALGIIKSKNIIANYKIKEK